MLTIKIYSDECNWLYDSSEEWREYCGCMAEDFEETYVIKGNRDYRDIADASWYKTVMDLIGELDNDPDDEDKEYICSLYNISENQYEECKKIYDNCRYPDDNDTVVKFLKVLYPDDQFDTCTIRGYVQRDYNNVIYKVNAPHDLKALESFYFGMVSEVYCEEENVVGVLTDDDIWNAERKGNIKKVCCDALGIDYEDDIKVYIADGYTIAEYTQVINWKEA